MVYRYFLILFKKKLASSMSLKQLQSNQQDLHLGIFRPKGVAAEKMRS